MLLLHMSKKPIKAGELKPVHGNQFRMNPLFYNPRGLWYSCGDTWIRHMISNEERSNYYFYSIDTSKLKICRLSTLAELDAFNEKFINREAIDLAHIIDWMRVKKEYDGLQICPFLSGKYGEMFKYIHDNVNVEGKGKINDLFFNEERGEEDFAVVPKKYRGEMKRLLADNPKYLHRMWCIGWEVASGVIWKNYGKMGIESIKL